MSEARKISHLLVNIQDLAEAEARQRDEIIARGGDLFEAAKCQVRAEVYTVVVKKLSEHYLAFDRPDEPDDKVRRLKRDARDLRASADRAWARGRKEEAHRLHDQAAELERQALLLLPKS